MVMYRGGNRPRIRAIDSAKILNSGSPERFQPQPSLSGGALRWMQTKPMEIVLPGLTPPKPVWFSRSHVAAHSHPRIHRARRPRRGLDPFASRPRTYYPTNRCGTDRRVSKTARYPSKPAPDQVRVFSFQNPSISILPLRVAFHHDPPAHPEPADAHRPHGGCVRVWSRPGRCHPFP